VSGCYNSCTLYRGLCPVPTRSDFITFQRLENLHVAMLAKRNHTFFGVRPGDHYMPLQRFTLGSMTCLAKISHRGHSCIAKVSPQRPLLHHAVYRYSHTLLCTTEQDTLPKAIQIIQQAIPYQTHGSTVCPGWSTPKNRSLADSSKNHPQTMKVATFPTISRPCSNLGIYQLWVHSHRTGWKITNHHSSISS
jgi:hypothetical protein